MVIPIPFCSEWPAERLVVPLEDIFLGEPGAEAPQAAAAKLKQLMDETTTLTSKEDLIASLRLALLSKVARQQK